MFLEISQNSQEKTCHSLSLNEVEILETAFGMGEQALVPLQ